MPALSEDQKDNALWKYYRRKAQGAFDRRSSRRALETIQTPDALLDYQNRMRAFFVDRLGGFPDRCDLNSDVVGRLEREDCVVEKVMFESRPHHHVTATLYLPKGEGPHPGVIVPCGHAANGKAFDDYQMQSILLAQNGLAALCYDPIGQGERYQALDTDGHPRFKGSLEHSLVGIGCLLAGTNTAAYRIYDGMRALGYLQSRPDIVSDRLGCTGCSGGGTLTSYLVALDDRIRCASPSCYITSLERLMDTRGPQDAEQNIHGQIEFGMDHAEYLMMRAPVPVLIAASTDDMFDIGGTWDTFRELKRVYSMLGFSERIDLVEAAGPHGLPMTQRVAIVRWMRRWLMDCDDAVTESDIEPLAEEALQCTPDGQVMLLDGERSVFDMNAARVTAYQQDRSRFRDVSAADRSETVQKILSWKSGTVEGTVACLERHERDGFVEEDRLLRLVDGLSVPFTAFLPDRADRSVKVILIDQVENQVLDEAASQARRGATVFTIDLPGFGKTAADTKTTFFAYMLGDSLVAAQTRALVAILHTILQEAGSTSAHVIADGDACIPALHAAAIENERVEALELRNVPDDWSDLVNSPPDLETLGRCIHGVLHAYDISDLVAVLGTERFEVASATAS